MCRPRVNAPVSIYTDGLPIVIPTEERVASMLKGTSHKPDEIITYQSDRGRRMFEDVKKGDVVRFQPMKWTATVEKVATERGDGRLQAGVPAGRAGDRRVGRADRNHRVQQPVVRASAVPLSKRSA